MFRLSSADSVGSDPILLLAREDQEVAEPAAAGIDLAANVPRDAIGVLDGHALRFTAVAEREDPTSLAGLLSARIQTRKARRMRRRLRGERPVEHLVRPLAERRH